MWFAPNVIRSIFFLYLLNCDLCHALDGSGDFDIDITTDFPVEVDAEDYLLPVSDTIKRIYKEIKNTSDNQINYDDIVFGNDSDGNYKSLYDYNSNENNVCFLDNLKRNLLWWSHQNGSLVADGEDDFTNL